MAEASAQNEREEGEEKRMARRQEEIMAALGRWETARGGLGRRGKRSGRGTAKRGGWVADKNWLSLSCPPRGEANNLKRKRDQNRGAAAVCIKEEEGEQNQIRSLSIKEEDGVPEGLLPFKKRRLWTEDVVSIGLDGCGRPAEPPPPSPAREPAEFLLQKVVTQSDASRAQHRLQLAQSDVRDSPQPMQDLAQLARDHAAVPVQVLDRNGTAYTLSFKFIPSSHTFRFMGPGYSAFLTASGLRAGQTIRIWCLPRGRNGVHRLSFLNSDSYSQLHPPQASHLLPLAI